MICRSDASQARFPLSAFALIISIATAFCTDIRAVLPCSVRMWQMPSWQKSLSLAEQWEQGCAAGSRRPGQQLGAITDQYPPQIGHRCGHVTTGSALHKHVTRINHALHAHSPNRQQGKDGKSQRLLAKVGESHLFHKKRDKWWKPAWISQVVMSHVHRTTLLPRDSFAYPETERKPGSHFLSNSDPLGLLSQSYWGCWLLSTHTKQVEWNKWEAQLAKGNPLHGLEKVEWTSAGLHSSTLMTKSSLKPLGSLKHVSVMAETWQCASHRSLLEATRIGICPGCLQNLSKQFHPNLSTQQRHRKQIYSHRSDYTYWVLENNPVLQAAKNWVKEQISTFKTLSDQRKISYHKQGVLGYVCAPLSPTSIASRRCNCSSFHRDTCLPSSYSFEQVSFSEYHQHLTNSCWLLAQCHSLKRMDRDWCYVGIKTCSSRKQDLGTITASYSTWTINQLLCDRDRTPSSFFPFRYSKPRAVC